MANRKQASEDIQDNGVVIEEGSIPLFTVEDSKPQEKEPVKPTRTYDLNGMTVEDF